MLETNHFPGNSSNGYNNLPVLPETGLNVTRDLGGVRINIQLTEAEMQKAYDIMYAANQRRQAAYYLDKAVSNHFSSVPVGSSLKEQMVDIWGCDTVDMSTPGNPRYLLDTIIIHFNKNYTPEKTAADCWTESAEKTLQGLAELHRIETRRLYEKLTQEMHRQAVLDKVRNAPVFPTKQADTPAEMQESKPEEITHPLEPAQETVLQPSEPVCEEPLSTEEYDEPDTDTDMQDEPVYESDAEPESDQPDDDAPAEITESEPANDPDESDKPDPNAPNKAIVRFYRNSTDEPVMVCFNNELDVGLVQSLDSVASAIYMGSVVEGDNTTPLNVIAIHAANSLIDFAEAKAKGLLSCEFCNEGVPGWSIKVTLPAEETKYPED